MQTEGLPFQAEDGCRPLAIGPRRDQLGLFGVWRWRERACATRGEFLKLQHRKVRMVAVLTRRACWCPIWCPIDLEFGAAQCMSQRRNRRRNLLIVNSLCGIVQKGASRCRTNTIRS